MTNLKREIAGIFIVLFLVSLPIVALAQFGTGGGSGFNTGGGNSGGVTIQNPLGSGVSDFPALIKKLFDALLPIGVAVSVLFIVWAGFKFVFAQGNPEKLKEARWTFLYTIIGIGIFLAAWSIANVVWNTVKALQSGT